MNKEDKDIVFSFFSSCGLNREEVGEHNFCLWSDIVFQCKHISHELPYLGSSLAQFCINVTIMGLR